MDNDPSIMKGTTMRKICLWITVMLMYIALVGCSQTTSETTSAPRVSEQTDTVTVKQDTKETDTTQYDIPEQSDTDTVTTEEDNTQHTGELKVMMLDVGQGLSVLFEADGHYILYDGGNRKHSSYVVSFLKQHGVANVDYLIVSHYDEDHIAGLIGVLNTTPVETAIIPKYETDTDIYVSFMNAVNNAESVVYAETGNSYSLGNVTIDVLYGCDSSEESENDMSTVIKVSDGEFSCILTGDAEYATEDTLVNSGSSLDCTLYVVGHHGSSSSSSEKFVKAMSPEIAFIGVGADNSYGHPTDKTLTTLTASSVTVYRTDTQGVITLNYSMGQYVVSTDKEYASADVANNTVNASSDDVTYVLNISSMKFHLLDCSSVEKMADYNKEYASNTREELIEEGYAPCRMCKP